MQAGDFLHMPDGTAVRVLFVSFDGWVVTDRFGRLGYFQQVPRALCDPVPGRKGHYRVVDEEELYV